MARANRRPIKATLYHSRSRHTVLVEIGGSRPDLPQWIEWDPHDRWRPLRTAPPTAFLDGSTGEWGTSAAIVDYVRRYVDGRLSRDAAEAGIAAALATWPDLMQ